MLKINPIIANQHDPKKFTGDVYTVVYNPHEQGFANFSIATLKIEKGVIKDISLSDKFLGFETGIRIKLAYDTMIDEMRRKYPEGYRHV